MASRLKLHLLCIDQQKDFTSRNGALPVPNGTENAERTAQMIERYAPARVEAMPATAR